MVKRWTPVKSSHIDYEERELGNWVEYRDYEADLAAANARADEATEALNRANDATSRAEAALAMAEAKLAAQERELAVLREYAHASRAYYSSDVLWDPEGRPLRMRRQRAWKALIAYLQEQDAQDSPAGEAEKKLAQRNAIHEVAVAVAEAADDVSTCLRLMLNTPAKDMDRFLMHKNALQDARLRLDKNLTAYRAAKEAGDATKVSQEASRD